MRKLCYSYTLLVVRCKVYCSASVDSLKLQMPRKHDLLLERKLVRAAHNLCSREGLQAVTMRRVALLANTCTPTLYQRFADREALLQALREPIRKSLAREMLKSTSPEDACSRYLRFATRRPHEYRLLMHGIGHIKAPDPHKRSSVFEAVQTRLAEIFGGSPGAYDRVALQLWCLVHGAASLLIERGESIPETEEIREACRLACKNIVDFEVASRTASKSLVTADRPDRSEESLKTLTLFKAIALL